MEDIIIEFEKYMEDFLEKKNLNFDNKPICPFAKKARLGKYIKYIVSSLEENSLIQEIDKNTVKEFNILIFLNIDKDFDLMKLEETVNSLKSKYEQYEFFSGHPKSEFKVNGVYTRKEP